MTHEKSAAAGHGFSNLPIVLLNTSTEIRLKQILANVGVANKWHCKQGAGKPNTQIGYRDGLKLNTPISKLFT